MTNIEHKYSHQENYDKLIENNTGLVHSVIKRFAGYYEYDDLYQIGCIGLCKAAKRFNPELGYSFSTYAVPLIIGEIKRFIRDDGIIKVSRHYKEISYKTSSETQKYIEKNGKEPSISELADLTGFSKEDILTASEATKSPIYIDSASKEDNQTNYHNLLSDKFTDELYVNKIALNSIINSFSARDKKLIMLRYFKDKTQLETANLLGISQVQVSRIEKQLLNRIKIHLKT